MMWSDRQVHFSREEELQSDAVRPDRMAETCRRLLRIIIII